MYNRDIASQQGYNNPPASPTLANVNNPLPPQLRADTRNQPIYFPHGTLDTYPEQFVTTFSGSSPNQQKTKQSVTLNFHDNPTLHHMDQSDYDNHPSNTTKNLPSTSLPLSTANQTNQFITTLKNQNGNNNMDDTGYNTLTMDTNNTTVNNNNNNNNNNGIGKSGFAKQNFNFRQQFPIGMDTLSINHSFTAGMLPPMPNTKILPLNDDSISIDCNQYNMVQQQLRSKTLLYSLDLFVSAAVKDLVVNSIYNTVYALCPNRNSEQYRQGIRSYIKQLIRKSLGGSQLYFFGDSILKAYSPVDPVELSIFVSKTHESNWLRRIVSTLLCQETLLQPDIEDDMDTHDEPDLGAPNAQPSRSSQSKPFVTQQPHNLTHNNSNNQNNNANRDLGAAFGNNNDKDILSKGPAPDISTQKKFPIHSLSVKFPYHRNPPMPIFERVKADDGTGTTICPVPITNFSPYLSLCINGTPVTISGNKVSALCTAALSETLDQSFKSTPKAHLLKHGIILFKFWALTNGLLGFDDVYTRDCDHRRTCPHLAQYKQSHITPTIPTNSTTTTNTTIPSTAVTTPSAAYAANKIPSFTPTIAQNGTLLSPAPVTTMASTSAATTNANNNNNNNGNSSELPYDSSAKSTISGSVSQKNSTTMDNRFCPCTAKGLQPALDGLPPSALRAILISIINAHHNDFSQPYDLLLKAIELIAHFDFAKWVLTPYGPCCKYCYFGSRIVPIRDQRASWPVNVTTPSVVNTTGKDDGINNPECETLNTPTSPSSIVPEKEKTTGKKDKATSSSNTSTTTFLPHSSQYFKPLINMEMIRPFVLTDNIAATLQELMTIQTNPQRIQDFVPHFLDCPYAQQHNLPRQYPTTIPTTTATNTSPTQGPSTPNLQSSTPTATTPAAPSIRNTTSPSVATKQLPAMCILDPCDPMLNTCADLDDTALQKIKTICNNSYNRFIHLIACLYSQVSTTNNNNNNNNNQGYNNQQQNNNKYTIQESSATTLSIHTPSVYTGSTRSSCTQDNNNNGNTNTTKNKRFILKSRRLNINLKEMAPGDASDSDSELENDDTTYLNEEMDLFEDLDNDGDNNNNISGNKNNKLFGNNNSSSAMTTNSPPRSQAGTRLSSATVRRNMTDIAVANAILYGLFPCPEFIHHIRQVTACYRIGDNMLTHGADSITGDIFAVSGANNNNNNNNTTTTNNINSTTQTVGGNTLISGNGNTPFLDDNTSTTSTSLLPLTHRPVNHISKKGIMTIISYEQDGKVRIADKLYYYHLDTNTLTPIDGSSVVPGDDSNNNNNNTSSPTATQQQQQSNNCYDGQSSSITSLSNQYLPHQDNMMQYKPPFGEIPYEMQHQLLKALHGTTVGQSSQYFHQGFHQSSLTQPAGDFFNNNPVVAAAAATNNTEINPTVFNGQSNDTNNTNSTTTNQQPTAPSLPQQQAIAHALGLTSMVLENLPSDYIHQHGVYRQLVAANNNTNTENEKNNNNNNNQQQAQQTNGQNQDNNSTSQNTIAGTTSSRTSPDDNALNLPNSNPQQDSNTNNNNNTQNQQQSNDHHNHTQRGPGHNHVVTTNGVERAVAFMPGIGAVEIFQDHPQELTIGSHVVARSKEGKFSGIRVEGYIYGWTRSGRAKISHLYPPSNNTTYDNLLSIQREKIYVDAYNNPIPQPATATTTATTTTNTSTQNVAQQSAQAVQQQQQQVNNQQPSQQPQQQQVGVQNASMSSMQQQQQQHQLAANVSTTTTPQMQDNIGSAYFTPMNPSSQQTNMNTPLNNNLNMNEPPTNYPNHSQQSFNPPISNGIPPSQQSGGSSLFQLNNSGQIPSFIPQELHNPNMQQHNDYDNNAYIQQHHHMHHHHHHPQHQMFMSQNGLNNMRNRLNAQPLMEQPPSTPIIINPTNEYDVVLNGDLTEITQSITQARQFQYTSLSEERLVELIVHILRTSGPLSIGRIGSKLHETTNNHSLPGNIRAVYGGLKRFCELHANVFTVGTDHPYNPHVYLIDCPPPPQGVGVPPVQPAVTNNNNNNNVGNNNNSSTTLGMTSSGQTNNNIQPLLQSTNTSGSGNTNVVNTPIHAPNNNQNNNQSKNNNNNNNMQQNQQLQNQQPSHMNQQQQHNQMHQHQQNHGHHNNNNHMHHNNHHMYNNNHNQNMNKNNNNNNNPNHHHHTHHYNNHNGHRDNQHNGNRHHMENHNNNNNNNHNQHHHNNGMNLYASYNPTIGGYSDVYSNNNGQQNQHNSTNNNGPSSDTRLASTLGSYQPYTPPAHHKIDVQPYHPPGVGNNNTSANNNGYNNNNNNNNKQQHQQTNMSHTPSTGAINSNNSGNSNNHGNTNNNNNNHSITTQNTNNNNNNMNNNNNNMNNNNMNNHNHNPNLGTGTASTVASPGIDQSRYNHPPSSPPPPPPPPISTPSSSGVGQQSSLLPGINPNPFGAPPPPPQSNYPFLFPPFAPTIPSISQHGMLPMPIGLVPPGPPTTTDPLGLNSFGLGTPYQLHNPLGQYGTTPGQQQTPQYHHHPSTSILDPSIFQ